MRPILDVSTSERFDSQSMRGPTTFSQVGVKTTWSTKSSRP
ncbi:hypothetical protein RB196_04820 [Streptomyces sp. PmtA]